MHECFSKFTQVLEPEDQVPNLISSFFFKNMITVIAHLFTIWMLQKHEQDGFNFHTKLYSDTGKNSVT